MIPSVTTILAPWSDFSKIPEEVLQAAAERGTRVHKACASITRGLWAPVPIDIRGYVDSFKRAFDYVDEVLLTEEPVSSRTFGYMGHPDIVWRYRGEDLWTLIDNKTPRAHLLVWNAQISAYDHAVEEDKGIVIGRSGSLRLHPDGKRPIFDELTKTERIRGFEAFCGSLTAWKYFNKAGG